MTIYYFNFVYIYLVFFFFEVGCQMHACMKPARDASTASRMIGAALGVRIKKTNDKSQNASTTTTPSIKKEDAWDD